VLFSATAGQIADKVEKGRLARYVKLLEIAIMLVAAVGWMTHTLWLLIARWSAWACTRPCSARSSTPTCRST
jgi:type III secretory pathway component EscS